MRRSASEVIRNLEMRIARLERSTMKKASTNLPDFAIDGLFDEIYDETGITFDESMVRDLNDKSLGSYSSVHLVSVMNHLAGEFFAVIHIYMDDYPKSPSSDVVIITKDRSEAFRKFKNFRG